MTEVQEAFARWKEAVRAHKEAKQALGEALRRAKIKRGVTQNALADELGVRRQEIHRLLRTTKEPETA